MGFKILSQERTQPGTHEMNVTINTDNDHNNEDDCNVVIGQL